MIWLLVAWLLLAGAIGLAWRREMRRLEREQRRRALLASDAARRLTREFERMKVQIGDALIPAIRKAALALGPLVQIARDAELKRVNEYQKGGTPR